VVDFRRIGFDPSIAAWSAAARGLAVAALKETEQPLRCGGTWAVGLELLDNAPDGSLGGVAFPWAAVGLAPAVLHRGQVSAVYPGYPQPSDQESAAAFRFRVTRDAAHVDGLLAEGEAKRRFIREPHAWILGLPLGDSAASPLVVWRGSVEIIRAGLLDALREYPVEMWGQVDVTEAYVAARRRVFEDCARVELPGRIGEAVLVHRLAVHGVAPWGGADLDEGRMVAYFRPVMASVREWVMAP
jgi:hypothetical protein